MVNLKTLRAAAKSRLDAKGYENPLCDIDCILLSLGFKKSDILLGDKTLDTQSEQSFHEALCRLEEGEPVQYIIGRTEFMSLNFEVNSATLIPRADTEILVEAVIDLCNGIKNPDIFEVGSGSGCIAISLAHYINGAKVTSVDVSKDALKVARQNARNNNVSVEFIEHNILNGFPKLKALPDIIVSNPPYIPSKDVLTLSRKVRDFEPKSALDGGEDGLDFYRFLCLNAPLKEDGYLALEVGINQSLDVAKLMDARFRDIKIIKDLSGIDRVVIGKLK